MKRWENQYYNHRIIVLSVFILFLINFSSAKRIRTNTNFNPGSAALIRNAFEGIDTSLLIDYHVHIFGIGAGNTGNIINKKMQSIAHPIRYTMYKTYLDAAGINDMEKVDQQYVDRLKTLIKTTPHHGKYAILAFDKYYNPDGSVNIEKTEYYVPNEYVFALAEKYPNLFIPVMSVHPYRKDAMDELIKFASRGGRIVKWLPNAMGIDPSDKKCEPFYQKMKELNLVLLSHAGDEKAVESEDDQSFGNPLLLKKPLDMGVKVIVAHCASLGKSIDLEDTQKGKVSNFELLLRLMDRKEYQNLLFADISTLTLTTRCGKPLKTMLQRTDLHPRLVNGSDYPLPAVNVVIRLRKLVEEGYISKQEAKSLHEIFETNPLLFDFVLKRTLKDPLTGIGFPISVFERNQFN